MVSGPDGEGNRTCSSETLWGNYQRSKLPNMASPAQPRPQQHTSNTAGLAPLAYNGAQKKESPGGVGMTQNWKQWEGQIADGKFPLQQYLGGSDHSAVFLTRREQEPRRAAIKLLPAADRNAEGQILKWKLAMKLPHPNLLHIYEAGQCELNGTKLLYVVMEQAEENLAEILTQRPLTTSEAKVMLPSLLDALGYLHGKGFVHGQIKPANILASADQVKLSSDTISPITESATANETARPAAYDPPGPAGTKVSALSDVWSLGMALVEVLTAQTPVWKDKNQEPAIPKEIDQPFPDIVANCLRLEPSKRWTLDQIRSRLTAKTSARQMSPVAERKGSLPKWQYVIFIVAAVVLIAYLVWPKGSHSPASPAPSEAKNAQPSTPVKPKPSIPENKQSARKSTPAPPPEASPAVNSSDATIPAQVLHQVSPQVAPSARATIQGKVRVSVKVMVDNAGNIASARLESAGPSKYFSRLAQQAAQQWKFTPAQRNGHPVPSEWIIRFAFGRSGTDMTSNQISR